MSYDDRRHVILGTPKLLFRDTGCDDQQPPLTSTRKIVEADVATATAAFERLYSQAEHLLDAWGSCFVAANAYKRAIELFS
jgi:hypothetical protein